MLAALLLVLLGPGAAPGLAADDPSAARIAAGVRVGGVAVGGLDEHAAAVRIAGRLRSRIERTTVLRAGGRRYRMSAHQAGLRLDAGRSVARALQAPAGRSLAPAIEVSLARVRHWVATRPGRAGRRARSARLRVGRHRISVRRSRTGWYVAQAPTVRLLLRTVRRLGASRRLRKQVTHVRPRVSTAALRARYPTFVLVDRRRFRLRLYKRLRLARVYGIAVGMGGHTTPAGTYRVQTKQRCPVWHAPNAAWAGSAAGRTFRCGDPRNPIRGRWIGVNGAVGIHGTSEPWSIGTRASHGCIRMRVGSVKRLYRRVPIGTPVRIT